ncbi:hypothetical protein CLV63_12434 [Murinocardiopsis flavida]|uniref:Uncharacterized protein n=1 Tax=Murinocardiopsis flavida TaxID=645275 RepID=A0A2P8CY79_9ACTN|nr:hypothetical protein [Murinocardiopsis flavida]PSK89930.1 hypothetical protein CLV63_12434 [Murinocardiopsis flavida]
MSIPPELVLALLYAGSDAVILRGSDGALEVVPATRAESDGQILYSQEQLLSEGIAGLGLVA